MDIILTFGNISFLDSVRRISVIIIFIVDSQRWGDVERGLERLDFCVCDCVSKCHHRESQYTRYDLFYC
jgi:hypothetical protein